MDAFRVGCGCCVVSFCFDFSCCLLGGELVFLTGVRAAGVFVLISMMFWCVYCGFNLCCLGCGVLCYVFGGYGFSGVCCLVRFMV